MAIRQIDVHTPFTLRLVGKQNPAAGFRELSFGKGIHEVDDEVADHRYTQHFINTEEADKPAGQEESVNAEQEELLQDDQASDGQESTEEADKPAGRRGGRGRSNR